MKSIKCSLIWLTVIALVVFLMINNIYQIITFLPSRIFDWDFNHYYLTAWLLHNGFDPYTTSMSAANSSGAFIVSNDIRTASNPPLLIYLLTTLSTFSPEVAFWIWVGVQVASLFFILLFCYFILKPQVELVTIIYLTMFCLSSRIVAYHFYYSQAQLLISCILLLALYLFTKGHHKRACMVASFAGLIKIYPFVMLPWFIYRGSEDFRETLRRAGVSLGTIIACVFITKPELWKHFTESSPDIIMCFMNSSGNYSLPSLISVFGVGRQLFDTFGISQQVTIYIIYLSALSIPIAALVYCWKYQFDINIEFSLLTTAMLIGNIVTWPHYLVFLIFPIAVILNKIKKNMNVIYSMFLIVSIFVLDLFSYFSKKGVHDTLFSVFLNYIPLAALFYILAIFTFFLPKQGEITGQHQDKAVF